MIVAELPGGRELLFPDAMKDADVDAIVRALLAAERGSAEAKAEAKAVRDRLDAVLAQPRPENNAAVIAELKGMIASLERGFNRVVTAQLADRKLEHDIYGNPISKVSKG